MYNFKEFISLKLILFFRKYLLILFIFYPSIDIKSENNFVRQKQNPEITSENIENLSQQILNYRLGAGDQIYININDIQYLSGERTIGPDGYLILPELIKLNVSGLTIKSLEEELNLRYKTYVKNPNTQIYITSYRPVRVYVHGEVKRPGYYSIELPKISSSNQINKDLIDDFDNESDLNQINIFQTSPSITNGVFPTVFDAIKSSRGITPFSDLSNVYVIRKITNKNGEQTKYKTVLNFLSLITEGDQSQNIRILDGDSIFVEKSNIILKEQFIKARNSNLTPDNINVYVSGNVAIPGLVIIPKGSGLNQALARAGGQKILSGNVEFLRFNDYGDSEKRSFKYSSNARINTRRNPILMDGDIIHINESLFEKSSKVITRITDPVLRTYGLYSIFN